MQVRQRFSFALLVAAIPLVAWAVPAAARTSVTVYTRDLGFVREDRALQVSGSNDTVRVSDIPERIDVPSVRLAPESGRITRLAYRFDVATGDGLLETSRGSRVRVAMRDDRVVEGTLLASDGAWIVVRENDGSVHSLSRTAVDDVRMVSSTGLVTRPMLEAAIEGARSGRVPAQLSYLTGGMSWNAEHTLVRRGETTATWSSSVTVENTTGRDYDDVTLKLVAGEPRRISPSPVPMYRGQTSISMMSEAKVADLSEQSFSEYHLYSLDHPATLRDRETQQLSMLEPREVKVTPRYRYRANEGNGVQAELRLVNSKEAGLGVPIPGGRVRVYELDASGALQFSGESSIRHTAEAETLTAGIGQAFDLVAERRETSNRRISDHEREYSVEVRLRNRKPNDVTILVEEMVSGDVEITQKSQPFVQRDANILEFRVPVRAGKEAVVTYTARQRY